MKTNRLIKASILCIFGLYSCSFENTTNFNQVQKIDTYKNKDTTIKGIVDFGGFKVKNEAEISRKATVSLIYPSDYTDITLRNTTLATGITDNNGGFTINTNQNYVPELNKVMILEATKRVNGVGNAIVSLRTHIRWNGNSWDSISGSVPLINKKTTALAIISALDSNILSLNDSINKIVNDNVIYDAKLTEGIFNWTYDLINQSVFELKDPVQEIYSLTPNGFPYSTNSTKAVVSNAHSLQTTLETYAVDWNGNYPDNTIGLETEAKNKKYWRNLKNPFANLDSITAQLPSIMNYNDYQQAKITLNYKGIQLQNKGNLKGIVLYQPYIVPNTYYQSGNNNPNAYAIYAIDVAGDLMRNPNIYFSSIFMLSNG